MQVVLRRHPIRVTSNRLRATMEQEVFFGANVEVSMLIPLLSALYNVIVQNPFLFQLETQFDGGLGLAVERLSQDILNSRELILSIAKGDKPTH